MPDPKVRKYSQKQYNQGANIEERRYLVAPLI